MNDSLLFKNLDMIESLSLPYCVINNTLLSLYRDHTCFPQLERECVILMNSIDKIIIFKHPNMNLIMDSVSGLGNLNMHEKIAVNFMTPFKDKIAINPWSDFFFVMEKDIILPYSEIIYKERKIPIPHKPEKYLEIFYGDWKTPIPPEKWDWVYSKGIIHASSIEDAYTKYSNLPL